MMVTLALVSLLAATSSEISGQITLSSGKPAANAVVWVEGGAKSKPLKGVVVDQRDRKFIPHISVVTVGTVVDFPNHDVIMHNVFTEYHSERFDFGVYPRNATKRWKFDRTGVAVLLCTIHPDMGAYVVCVDTPHFAVADSKGRFRIPSVPSGKYTLRFWHESGEQATRPTLLDGNTRLDIGLAKRT